MDHAGFGLEILGGVDRARRIEEKADDQFGIGQDARGLTKREVEGPLSGENWRAFFKVVAQGVNLDEEGRQLDAELRGHGGNEAVGRIGVRPEDVEGSATGQGNRARASASE